MSQGIRAWFGLDPAPAKKGMKEAERAIKRGSKNIDASLKSLSRAAKAAFVGWGVGALAKDFAVAAMEMDSMRKSMGAAVGGMEKGRREINYLRIESQKMGLSFQNQIKDYKQLTAAAKGTALEGSGVRKVWRSLQDATVALQLSTAETSGTIWAFKDMLSKGSVQAEELKRQLGNRLPGAFRLAADAMMMSTTEMMNHMKQGKIMTDTFLPALAKKLSETYGGAALESAKTMRAEVNRLHSAWFDFKSMFMETTGASELLTSGLKMLTGVVTFLNDNMKGIAKIVAHINGVGIFMVDMMIGGFITLSSAAKQFTNALQFVKSTIEFIAKNTWVAFKFNALIAINSIDTALNGMFASMKESLAEFIIWTAGKMSKIMPESATIKMLEVADALMASSNANKQAVNDETQALKERKTEALKGIKIGMTLSQWEKNNTDILNKKTSALQTHRQIIKELYQANVDLFKSKQKSLSRRKDLPIDIGGGFPTELTEWELILKKLSQHFSDLESKSTDVAKNIASAFTSAFKGIEDALVQLVVKGKIEWRSLAESMASDMVRLAYQQAVLGPLAGAMSVGFANLGSMFGSSLTAGASASVAPASIPMTAGPAPIMMAKGGTINEHIVGFGQSSGRRYEMGESGKEHVLNQDQMKSLGSNKGVAVSVKPQINISTPPGTQATTQQSSDGMNIDVLISTIENKLASNGRRGSVLFDTMGQQFGLNRASGAFR